MPFPAAILLLLLLAPPFFAADTSAVSIFQSTNLISIDLQISPPEMEQLRSGFRARGAGNRSRARIVVREGSLVYTNVRAQLKGGGTFRSLDDRPSFTLDFNEGNEKQRFHGLTRISLNNSIQDPTCLNEKLARHLFKQAGVPVPQADHALVTLNGRRLGIYVLLEGYGKQFLKSHFGNNDGNLYDSGLLMDINQPVEINSGLNRTNRSDLAALVRAAFEPGPEKRFNAIFQQIDLDKFVSMMALETILCHWDGYSINRSNYRVYHDPKSNKLVFMPHGMDRILGNFLHNLDLRPVPAMQGIVSRALISTPQARRMHLEKVRALAKTLFDPDRLVDQVRSWDRKIAPEMHHLEARWFVPKKSVRNEDYPDDRRRLYETASSGNHAKDVDDLCWRIRRRADLLQMQLSKTLDVPPPAPSVEFNLQKVASITNWSLGPIDRQAQASMEYTEVEGQRVLKVVLPEGCALASLRAAVSLPAGRYALAGNVRAVPSPKGAGVIPEVKAHHSGNRFGNELRPPDWTFGRYSFSVAPGAAPEEVDLIWDIRDGPGEVLFDLASLLLFKMY